MKNHLPLLKALIKFVGPVVGVLMLLAGVPAFEVVRVVAILFVQMTAGVMIWGFIDPQSFKSMPLTIGAGSTIGFCASTLFHQLLRTTPFSGIAWLLPLMGVLVFIFFKRKQRDLDVTSNPLFSFKNFLPILVMFTTIGLGDQWWWIYPIVFLSGALTIANFLHKSIFRIVLLVSPFALLLSVVLRKMNYLWWIMTNDIPFLESLAYSVNRWGPRKNISAVGTELSYHWFALAWSGMTTQLSGAQSWTVLTIMLPIVVCMTIGLLVWGIIYEATTSSMLATLGAASVLLLRDVVSVTSPTNMFSFTIMFVLILMMKRWLETHSIRPQAAITAALLLFCLFGSKVSTGGTLMAGAGLAILFNNSATKLTRVKILTASVITSAASYMYFFGNQQRSSQHSLTIGFPNIGGLLIVDRPLGGGQLHVFLEVYTYILFILPMLSPIILLFIIKKDPKIHLFNQFLIYAIFSGLMLGRFLDGSGTESYFIYATIPLSLILVTLLQKRAQDSLHLPNQLRVTTLLIGVGLILGYSRNMVSAVIKSNQNYSVVWRSAPYVVAFTIILFISIIIGSMVAKQGQRQRLAIWSLSLLLSSSIIGVQLNQRVNFSKNAFLFSTEYEPQFVKWNHLAGSPDQLGAINWIRENTPKSDIVATNRRCLQLKYCGAPRWLLLSALSHRQILLEGNTTGLPDSTPWVDERKILSEKFIENPDRAMAERLYKLGVRWHYVELNFIETSTGWEPLELAQKRSWEPWAKIAYRNETVLILQLLPPAN